MEGGIPVVAVPFQLGPAIPVIVEDRGALVDRPIAVIVLGVHALDGTREHVGVPVITVAPACVADAGSGLAEAVSVIVERLRALIDQAVTVLVTTVGRLERPWRNAWIGVVAVGASAGHCRPAIVIPIRQVEAITVLIHAVTDHLFGPGPDQRVLIITVGSPGLGRGTSVGIHVHQIRAVTVLIHAVVGPLGRPRVRGGVSLGTVPREEGRMAAVGPAAVAISIAVSRTVDEGRASTQASRMRHRSGTVNDNDSPVEPQT